MAFSFIHISDIHLGRAFSDLSEFSLDAKALPILKTAVENAFNNFINFALQRNVDFIIIAGDTFDGQEQDFNSKLILKEGLKKLDNAGIKVFLICANHDPISAYNKNTFNFDENSNIKIIGVNSNPYGSFIVSDKNNNPIAKIHAYSYNQNHIDENPLKYFEMPTNNIFNIGLLHCDLDADKSSPYAPVSTGELKSFNYNYWALGHIHIPTDSSDIAYSGTIQGRNTKETGPHGFKYIEVDNNKIINNYFITSDPVRFEDIEIDLSQSQDSTDAYDLIQENIKNLTETEVNNSFKLLLLKLTLSGSINFYSEIKHDFFETLTDRIKDNLNNYIYISEIINNTKPKVDTEILMQDDGISGEIYKAINKDNIISSINFAEEEIKNIIKQCHFDDNELTELQNNISKAVNNKCLDIANSVYFNELREE